MGLTPEALAALRQEYSARGLSREELDPNPFLFFSKWLAEAQQHGLIEPNAMVLSTVDASGQPWSRVVLLKQVDAEGFAFFTNYKGGKARQLEHCPNAALTFWWGAMERQINITGRVQKTSREVSEEYFASRPRSSQLGAKASPQSEIITGREELEARFAEAERQFEGREIPCPEHWGGYRLEPQTIEFWQGRRSRLHDRFRFTRLKDRDWKVEQLAP
jgi:pyridoxamine 5'-phosphate oxidase